MASVATVVRNAAAVAVSEEIAENAVSAPKQQNALNAAAATHVVKAVARDAVKDVVRAGNVAVAAKDAALVRNAHRSNASYRLHNTLLLRKQRRMTQSLQHKP